MQVYPVCDLYLPKRLEVDLDVVVGELGDLFSELRHIVAEFLRFDEVTRVQVPIFVEVEHLEHELGHDHRWLFKQRLVELLNESLHVDASVWLPIRQDVVEAGFKERRLVAKVLLEVLLQRLFGHVALGLHLLVNVLLVEFKEAPQGVKDRRGEDNSQLLQLLLFLRESLLFKALSHLLLVQFGA